MTEKFDTALEYITMRKGTIDATEWDLKKKHERLMQLKRMQELLSNPDSDVSIGVYPLRQSTGGSAVSIRGNAEGVTHNSAIRDEIVAWLNTEIELQESELNKATEEAQTI